MIIRKEEDKLVQSHGEASDQVGLFLLPPQFLRRPDIVSGAPGSSVAGTECCRALLQHGEGEAHLFIREDQEETTQRELKYLIQTEISFSSNWVVTTLSNLPTTLQTKSFTAFHNLGGPSFDLVAYARAFFSPHIFPISCMEYGFSYQPFLVDAVSKLLLAPTYPCDSVICASQVASQATERILERQQENLKRQYGLARQRQFRLDVIPHGVPVEIFKPRDRLDIRRQLELPLDKIILLYMGRLDPSSKSDVIPLLLSVQSLVKKYGDRLFLLMVGPLNDMHRGGLDKAVQELELLPYVHHRTNIPKVSVPLYYSAADIFVSLSDTLQENFGLTPVEAMASGLPVIVSDWAGYKETVVHDETGFKIPTTWAECDEDLLPLAPFYDWSSDHFYMGQSVASDMEALTYYLDLLISDEKLRLKMGEMARRHVLENFTWERSAAKFWDLWRELNRIAQGITNFTPIADSFLKPHYYGDFHDFATLSLELSMRLGLTERGLRVCKGKESLFLLEEPRKLLKADLMMVILRFLKFSRFSGRQSTVEGLVDLISKKRRIPASAARRHLMWLLKYDLVRIQAK